MSFTTPNILLTGLALVTCLGGCFSTRDRPPIDGRGLLVDAGPPDAGPMDSGIDAFTPFPDHDAGPLPAERGTILVVTYDRLSASGRLLRLDEIDRMMRPISSRIVPGTDVLDGLAGRVLAASIEVTRNGRVHVIETTEYSGPSRTTTIHSVDLETDTWRSLEVPSELGPMVVPDGDGAISAVARDPGDWDLVRWSADGITLDVGLAGVSAGWLNLALGGDGFLYAIESVEGLTRLHAIDLVDLETVRVLDAPFPDLPSCVDSDGSVVLQQDGGLLVRWTAAGATTRSSAAIPTDARLQAIGRSGEILVADRDGWVAFFSPDLTLSAEHSLPTELWTPRMAWAWADPAAR